MTTSTILLILTFAGAILVVNATSYCEICNVHTMCQTRRNGQTCHGKSLISKPPSNTDKADILHSHNRLRNKVAKGEETRGNGGPQPSAANMMMVEWDNELATIAQRAADQCIYDHDCPQCRTLIRDRKGVGQNAGILYYSTQLNAVNWTNMVENFYTSEVHLMPPQYASSYVYYSSNAHYSQMMWWNSRLVGCGASMYFESGRYKTLIFCNYRSGGNFPDAKVYEVGLPASKCPTGTQASNEIYTGLCVINGIKSRSTFHTDGKQLGWPEGMKALPGACQRQGFRLY